jgi:hypothetical protein
MATYGTFVDGNVLTAAEANDFLASTTVTPVVRQNATMTLSEGVGRRYRVNDLVYYTFTCTISGGSPTAGTRIEVDLPITAVSDTQRSIGVGFFIDNSPSSYILTRIVKVSTTRMAFLTATSTSLTSYLGTTNGPAITLAASDAIQGFVVYEAA